MEILPYTPECLNELCHVYNRAVAHVPHCYPIDAPTWEKVMPGNATESELAEQRVFILREDHHIAGIAHVGIGSVGWHSDIVEGIFRFLWYEPGLRGQAQQLLVTAEAHLREHGVRQVTVCPQRYRYPFYHLDHAYLSDCLGHVQALLQFSGYEKCVGEVYLDQPNFQPLQISPPDPTIQTHVEQDQGRGKLAGVVVRAEKDGQPLGVCECVSCGEFASHEAAQDWCFVEWLGVEDHFQGRGLGRYLLERTLQEMHRIGYRHTAISTDWKNYRAFVFYTNYGYRVVDWTYAFRRSLD